MVHTKPGTCAWYEECSHGCGGGQLDGTARRQRIPEGSSKGKTTAPTTPQGQLRLASTRGGCTRSGVVPGLKRGHECSPKCRIIFLHNSFLTVALFT